MSIGFSFLLHHLNIDSFSVWCPMMTELYFRKGQNLGTIFQVRMVCFFIRVGVLPWYYALVLMQAYVYYRSKILTLIREQYQLHLKKLYLSFIL